MATVYVDTVIGDDTRTYAQAQNPSTPWKTIGRSTQTSNPSGVTLDGDTIRVKSGYYRENFYVLGTQANKTWIADGYVEVIGPTSTTVQIFGASTSGNRIIGFVFRAVSGNIAFGGRYGGLNGTNNALQDCFFLPITRGDSGPTFGILYGVDEVGFGVTSSGCGLQSCVIKTGNDSTPSFRKPVSINLPTTTGAFIRDCTLFSPVKAALDTFNSDNPSFTLEVRRTILVGSSAGSEGAVVQLGGIPSADVPARWIGDDNLYFDLAIAPPSTKIVVDGSGTFYSLSSFKTTVAPDEALSAEGDPLFANATENAFVLKAGSPALSANGVTKRRGALNRGFAVSHSDTPRWGGTDPTFPGGNAGFVNPGVDNRIELKVDPSGAIQRSGVGEGAPAGFGIQRFGWEEDTSITFDGLQNDRVHDRTAHVPGSSNPIHIGVEVNAGAATGVYTNVERNTVLTSPLPGANVHVELVARSNYQAG